MQNFLKYEQIIPLGEWAGWSLSGKSGNQGNVMRNEQELKVEREK